LQKALNQMKLELGKSGKEHLATTDKLKKENKQKDAKIKHA
jgi:hypothetical protein